MMEPLASTEQVRIDVHLPDGGTLSELAGDTREGLARQLKELPPKYFYDERGSELFEQITTLPEYYPTRAERTILEQRGAEIVAAAGSPRTLVELGSGACSKTRCLLDAMRDAGCLELYIPVDISEEITRRAADELVAEYPGLRVRGVVCDFEHHLEWLPMNGGRLIAFLGGTIGNFDVEARHGFLARIAATMGPDDRLLLGTDLVKDRDRLEAAYDDSQGVTAEFNKNVLHVLNRELDADFDLARFEHRAFYDADEERIDIRLRSTADQRVRLEALDMEVAFAEGEDLRTELSCKFTPDSLERSYAEAGLEMTSFFTDPEELFALSLARVSG
ncbi:MAG: L-histidine Nalpha-methyltransferase [Solirubrobacterales bacterium]|jgi:L-histidine N-alpha-methyltransferase|nr:L-histidine Nalpha-methyltransferase [Solirubrobacterales bacterium]